MAQQLTELARFPHQPFYHTYDEYMHRCYRRNVYLLSGLLMQAVTVASMVWPRTVLVFLAGSDHEFWFVGIGYFFSASMILASVRLYNDALCTRVSVVPYFISVVFLVEIPALALLLIAAIFVVF